jgi:hypothetical protein
MSTVTVVMADPPARAAEALGAAGHTIVTTASDAGLTAAISSARRSADGSPLVLWGAGAAGGRILMIAALEGGVDAVIAVAPLVDPLAGALAGALAGLRERPAAAVSDIGRLTALARQPRPVRHAAKIRCPLLIQVADEDDANPPSAVMRAAWRSGADVRHYPCDAAGLAAGGAFLELAAAHQLVFLRQRLLHGKPLPQS